MRSRYVPHHQVEMTEKQISRLLRSCGLSDDRPSMANRLSGFGDFAAAEAVKEAVPLLAISDLPAFRESFSIVLDRLAAVSVFDAVLADMIAAPLRSQIFSGEPFALFEIDEGVPIPFSSTTIEDFGELLPVKVAALVAFTNEFLRGMTAEVDDTLKNAFLNAIARATDAALIRRLIPNAVTATPATNDFAADIQNAAQLILGGAAGRLHLIISPSTALQLGLSTTPDGGFLFPNFDVNSGGVFAGFPVHVSDQLKQDSTGPSAILFDASKIAANRGSIDIQRSENAVAQMRGDPVSGHAQVVSSFQTNSIFLRLLRIFGLKLPSEQIAVEFSGVNSWFS
ncbi:MAG: phage major capsid protein [Cellvibrionaceae bacterium]|nr:phage major capsid protein [Cellvibrionaceae bacterium]